MTFITRPVHTEDLRVLDIQMLTT
uniref:Uncharacterized protein n=1 Tax=Anguilla anguilla TaxID=7936 RepID=A0A0E9XQ16_ANGAN